MSTPANIKAKEAEANLSNLSNLSMVDNLPTSANIKAKEAKANSDRSRGRDTEGKDVIVNKWNQLFVANVAAIAFLCHGCVYTMTSFLLPQLQTPDNKDFFLTEDEGSWIASIFVFGSLGGSLSGAYMGDKIGRRRSLMLDHLVFLVGFGLMVASQDFWSLLAARYVLGHATASSFSTISVYISEISQSAIRSVAISLTMSYFCLSFGVSFSLGAVFAWRIAIGIMSIFPLVCLIALKFCPESPVWLLRMGCKEEANRALWFLRGNQQIIDEETERILANTKASKASASEPKLGGLAMAKKLFRKGSFLKPFSLALFMLVFGAEMSGLPTIAGFMVTILKESGIPMDPYRASVFIAVYRSGLNFLVANLVFKRKRRPMFLATGSLMALSTFTLGFYLYARQSGWLTGVPYISWTPMVCLLIMYSAYSLGYGTNVYCSQAEILPAEYRSFGCGIIGFLDNLALFFILKLVPTTISVIGLHGLFWMFSLSTFTTLTVFYFCMPEVHGLTLEAIEQRFSVKRRLPMEAKAAEAEAQASANV